MASRPQISSSPRRQATIGNVPAGPRPPNDGRCGPTHEVEHAAGAEGDLGRAGGDAALADERRLLVADDAADQRRAGQGGGLADGAARVDEGGHGRQGDAELLEHGVVPAGGVGGEQAGDAGVADVGGVDLALGEVPDDPGVDRADAEVAAAVGVGPVEQVGDLGGRLVGGEAQALALPDQAVGDGAQVLPAEAGGDGHAGGPLPDDGGGPLVGDADAVDRAGLGQAATGHGEGGVGHLPGVELDQPGHGGRGQHLHPVLGHDRGVGAHDRRPHAGRADVDDEDAHRSPPAGARCAPFHTAT